MIRKSEDIKGIKINKEYKLSQYADDTQFFLDGSESALNTTLFVLNKFYRISCLKINVEKNQSYMDRVRYRIYHIVLDTLK